METENRNGYGYESRQAAASNADCLAGLMFCYNMPESANIPEPASDDCPEAKTGAAEQAHADALMRYYNE